MSITKITDNIFLHYVFNVAPHHEFLDSATKELSNHFGIYISRYNLKDYVGRKRREGVNLRDASEYLSNKAFYNDLFLERETKHDLKNRKLKDENESLRAKYKRVLKDENLTNLIIDNIEKTVLKLPKIKRTPIINIENGKTNEDCILLLSDLHIGEVVNSEELNGLNEYNFEIFCKRLQFISDTIKDIVTNKLNGYKINNLHILGLGDWLCGNIHEELVETSDLNVVDQSFKGSLVISQFIRELSPYFESVNCEFIVGNHGRFSKTIKFKERYVNWDYVAYKIIELMLENIENINFNIPKSFFRVIEILNQRILLFHGDNIRSYAGTAYSGVEKTVNQFNEILQSNFDYCMLGHFHTQAELPRVNGEIFMNGSMIGGNEYSIGKIFKMNEPTQLFMGIHPEHGISWRYNLKLKYTDLNKELRYKY